MSAEKYRDRISGNDCAGRAGAHVRERAFGVAGAGYVSAVRGVSGIPSADGYAIDVDERDWKRRGEGIVVA